MTQLLHGVRCSLGPVGWHGLELLKEKPTEPWVVDTHGTLWAVLSNTDDMGTPSTQLSE